MEAHHNETLRKQKTLERKRKKEQRKPSEFEKNPGAGVLLGCTTIYMDSYQRARCTTAKLPNRYRSHNYLQQY